MGRVSSSSSLGCRAAKPPGHRVVSRRSRAAASPGHHLVAAAVVEGEGGADGRGWVLMCEGVAGGSGGEGRRMREAPLWVLWRGRGCEMSDYNSKFVYLYCRRLPGLARASWASFFSETDLIKTVSVNVLTEAVVLVTEAVPLCCPPRLIDFARRLFLTASVNKK